MCYRRFGIYGIMVVRNTLNTTQAVLTMTEQDKGRHIRGHKPTKTGARRSKTGTFAFQRTENTPHYSQRPQVPAARASRITTDRSARAIQRGHANDDSPQDSLLAALRSSGLRKDELEQLRILAERQRALLSALNLLEAKSFANLLTPPLTDSNISRKMQRMVEAGKVLALSSGNERYPAEQIDSSGRIFPALPVLIRSARHAGYDDWDIALWLFSPQIIVRQVTLGHPVGTKGILDDPDTLTKALLQNRTADDVITRKPIDALRQGDVALFKELAAQWLGRDPAIRPLIETARDALVDLAQDMVKANPTSDATISRGHQDGDS